MDMDRRRRRRRNCCSRRSAGPRRPGLPHIACSRARRSGCAVRSGFVNDIHTNGNVNSAREEYQLNGAQPGTTYQVQLVIYPSQSCAGAPFLTIPSSKLTTNGVGNGTVELRLPCGRAQQPAAAGRDRLAVPFLDGLNGVRDRLRARSGRLTPGIVASAPLRAGAGALVSPRYEAVGA